MKTVQVFESDDGVLFKSAAECRVHEQVLNAQEILNGLDLDWRDTGPQDVAEILVDAGFSIVPTSTLDRPCTST